MTDERFVRFVAIAEKIWRTWVAASIFMLPILYFEYIHKEGGIISFLILLIVWILMLPITGVALPPTWREKVTGAKNGNLKQKLQQGQRTQKLTYRNLTFTPIRQTANSEFKVQGSKLKVPFLNFTI